MRGPPLVLVAHLALAEGEGQKGTLRKDQEEGQYRKTTHLANAGPHPPINLVLPGISRCGGLGAGSSLASKALYLLLSAQKA